MSFSVLGKAVTLELKRDAQSDNRQPCLDQDADVTSAPDPVTGLINKEISEPDPIIHPIFNIKKPRSFQRKFAKKRVFKL